MSWALGYVGMLLSGEFVPFYKSRLRNIRLTLPGTACGLVELSVSCISGETSLQKLVLKF